MRSNLMDVVSGRPVSSAFYLRKGSNRRKQREERLGLSPYKQSMRASRIGIERKPNNHRLKVLGKILRAQVGRQWNDVFSDICRDLPHSQSHWKVRDYMSWMVDANCSRDRDGTLLNGFGYPVGGGDLYVDPDSGLLQRMPDSTKSKPRQYQLPYELVDNPDDPGSKFARLAGIWYKVRIVTAVAVGASNFNNSRHVVAHKSVWREFFPLWVREDVTPAEFARALSDKCIWHEDDDVSIAKQQLNGKEIARLMHANAA